jgi:penicillin-binding protein 1C
MQLIYPRKGEARLSLPKDFSGKSTGITFRLAHRNPETQVFWHIDSQFMGTTKTFHQIVVEPTVGKHLLVVVDENGNRQEQPFQVLEK